MSVTSVQKKVKMSDHSMTESDFKNKDVNIADDSDSDGNENEDVIEKEQIRPLEMDETHNGHLEKMDVDISNDLSTLPKIDKSNISGKDCETMEED